MRAAGRCLARWQEPLAQTAYLAGVPGFYAFLALWITAHPPAPLGRAAWLAIQLPAALAFACYVRLRHANPGFLTAENFRNELRRTAAHFDGLCFLRGRVCPVCEQPKPARSKHCGVCGQCVAVFDHHCPWLGACIGARNAGAFTRFLLSHVALAIWALWVAAWLGEIAGLCAGRRPPVAVWVLGGWAATLACVFLPLTAHVLAHHLRGTTLNEACKLEGAEAECLAQLHRLLAILRSPQPTSTAVERAETDLLRCERWAAWQHRRGEEGAWRRLLRLVVGRADAL